MQRAPSRLLAAFLVLLALPAEAQQTAPTIAAITAVHVDVRVKQRAVPIAPEIRQPKATDSVVTITVKNSDGTATDITSAAIVLAVRRLAADASPLISRIATITDGPGGVAAFAITQSDTAALALGDYLYSVEVTWVAGDREQLARALPFHVIASMGLPGDPVTSPTPEAVVGYGAPPPDATTVNKFLKNTGYAPPSYAWATPSGGGGGGGGDISITTVPPLTGGDVGTDFTLGCPVCVATTSSYANPSWLTSLGEAKILGQLGIPRGGTGLATTSQSFAFLGPASGSGAPSWRLIAAGDLPSLTLFYQPTDPDLTAIAALSSTVGMLARTGPGTFAVRTLTAASPLSIAFGDGGSGAPALTCSTCIHSGGSYSNPAWILSLDGSKLVANSVTTAQLDATGVSAGACGDSTHVPRITVGLDGRISNCSPTAISGGGGGGSGDATSLQTIPINAASPVDGDVMYAVDTDPGPGVSMEWQPAHAQAYATLKLAGSSVTQRTVANFGAEFGVVDNSGAGRTDITIAALGITNAMLAGSIANAKLANPSFGVTTTSPITGAATVALGGTLALGCASCLVTGDIGVTVQGFDSDLAAMAALSTVGFVKRSGSGTAVIIADPLPPANGGLGAASLGAHGVVVAEGASAAVVVGPDASTHKFLKAAGSSADPVFAAVDLAADVGSSILPIADGGTNSAAALTGSRLVTSNAGATAIVEGNVWDFISAEQTGSGTGGAAVDVTFAIPAGRGSSNVGSFLVTDSAFRVTVAPVGGTYSGRCGLSAGGQEIMPTTPLTTLGQHVGDAAAEQGSAFDTAKQNNGYINGSTTVTCRIEAPAGTVSTAIKGVWTFTGKQR